MTSWTPGEASTLLASQSEAEMTRLDAAKRLTDVAANLAWMFWWTWSSRVQVAAPRNDGSFAAAASGAIRGMSVPRSHVGGTLNSKTSSSSWRPVPSAHHHFATARVLRFKTPAMHLVYDAILIIVFL